MAIRDQIVRLALALLDHVRPASVPPACPPAPDPSPSVNPTRASSNRPPSREILAMRARRERLA